MQLLPELQQLDGVLKQSTRGLVFSGATAWRGADQVDLGRSDLRPRAGRPPVQAARPDGNAPEGEWETVASEWMGSPDDDGARSAGEAGLNYIFSNLTGDIRLTTAARLAYMSEPTFSKYFKRATGLTFSNMVKKLRVAHARRLLDSTDHPVTRVASLSGYHNMANFNRQFLAEVGTTPSAYRRMESSQKPPNEVLSLGLKAARAGEQTPLVSGSRQARRSSSVGCTPRSTSERRDARYSCRKVVVVREVPEQHARSRTNASGLRVGGRRGHLRRVHVIGHLGRHDLAARRSAPSSPPRRRPSPRPGGSVAPPRGSRGWPGG